jgi:hypothetical protein
MKKSIFIATLIVIAITGKAQEQISPDFRDMIQLGVKVGANYSNVYNVKADEFQADSKFGLATGVFVAVPLNKFIGFQPEILISQKGFQATGNILGSKYDFTRTTTYVDIPLLLSIKPSRYLNILAGPQYSYLVKEHDVFNTGSITVEQESEFKNTDVRRNTLCFLGGLDIDMKHLVLSFRAGWDVSNNNGDGSSTSPQYQNVWYQATLGYRLVND